MTRQRSAHARTHHPQPTGKPLLRCLGPITATLGFHQLKIKSKQNKLSVAMILGSPRTIPKSLKQYEYGPNGEGGVVETGVHCIMHAL